MLHTYFVAFTYRLGDGAWNFDNIEVNCELPIEQTDMRNEVTRYIASKLNAQYGGSHSVVINNWILLNSHFSAEARAQHLQRVQINANIGAVKITYFVAYNSNPRGTHLWHCGNVVINVDQYIEIDGTRECIVSLIEADLSNRFGGEHDVVISNWKLLDREYPGDTRALPKA